MSFVLERMNPSCRCRFCGCEVVARLDLYGTAQARWDRCSHLAGFERIDGKLYARFEEEGTDAPTGHRQPLGAAGAIE